MTYAEKLKDPRWQKKRLEILQLYDWKCGVCGNGKSNLQIHHLRYSSRTDPWEESNANLIVLCQKHHDLEHQGKLRLERCLLKALEIGGFGSLDIASLIKEIHEREPFMKQIAERKTLRTIESQEKP